MADALLVCFVGGDVFSVQGSVLCKRVLFISMSRMIGGIFYVGLDDLFLAIFKGEEKFNNIAGVKVVFEVNEHQVVATRL